MVMGIDPVRRRFQVQQLQNVQKVGESSQTQNSNNASASSGGSLMERLNGLDNKLNQGGGVSLSDSMSGQAGAVDAINKKRLWT